MMYQLHPIGKIQPMCTASEIDAAILVKYLAEAKVQDTEISRTFGNDLRSGHREYTNRKSFSFVPFAPAHSALVFDAMQRKTKDAAPKLWANDFSRDWVAVAAQGLKYITGGSFFAHADDRVRVVMAGVGNSGERRWVRNRPERQIVAVLYLNDDYEGGEIYFPTVNDANDKPLRIKPKTGDVLIFGCDERYTHGVAEVTKGERYCVTMWYAPLPIEEAETVESARRLYDQELKEKE